MELAERLLKAAEDEGPRMRRIRNLFLRNSVESMISELDGPYNLGSQDVSLGYQTYCPSSVASSLYCDAFDGVFGDLLATHFRVVLRIQGGAFEGKKIKK